MSTQALVIGAADYARRLRVVLAPGSGGGLPRRQRDRWILLHAIASTFREDERLTEKAATERIQDFLLARAPRLETDAVTLRRALVDEGFVDRDPAGRDYRPSRRHEARVRFSESPPDADDGTPAEANGPS
jgi:hypothetical protein